MSLELPTSFYEKDRAITITNNAQPLFLGCLHHREYYKEYGHCMYVNSLNEYMWIY